MTQPQQNGVTSLRHLLKETGYAPLPVMGKRPTIEAWEQKIDAAPAEIDLWEKVYQFANSTGILTRTTPALDIDIRDEEAAEAVEELARERFEERGWFIVRTGRPPKRAVLLRTDAPFKKVYADFIAPSGAKHRIEILGDGQQIVCFGVHPDTKKPYSWFGGEPGQIQREDLPYITEDEARKFVADATQLLAVKFGFQVAGRKAENGNGLDTGGHPADWSDPIESIQAGAGLHDSIRDLAAKLLVSGMSDGAAVNVLRALMESSDAARDDRWQDRFDDIPRAVATAREKFGGDSDTAEQSGPRKPFTFINVSEWSFENIPPREWAVLDRIPLRQTCLFSGEGSAGKSLTQLYLSVAHVLGRDWLGTMPEPGPAMFIDAEDDNKELHRRLAAVLGHYNVGFADVARELHLKSLAGQESTLATASRSGKIEPTTLYKELLEAAGDIKPKMIGIASSANVYAGNEIDRGQVQQFVSLLTRLAIVANGSVVLISHPSLTGINTDTGLSGSTQWHNSVRARMWLKSPKPEPGEQPDSDLREIVFKKNNYGPISASMVLRWKDGLFLPEPGMASLDRAAQEAKAEDVFLGLLRRFAGANRNVGDRSGPNYAPAMFSREDEAKKAGTNSKALADAMRRLFAAGKIWNEPCGKPSRPSHRLALKA